jgi:hypothetical protein
MPYAKTSLRAEQATLREKMRTAGMSYRQIAFEFARRYGLRPRAAWRHAYGWSLKEAAEQVNSHAGATGLDPGGKAAMTGPHLCEYESWPGHGTRPVGRRPTPSVLALLAAAYNAATIHDLLDLADYEHMPAGDRLILDKASSKDGPDDHGARPGTQPQRRARTIQVPQPPRPGAEPLAGWGMAALPVSTVPGRSQAKEQIPGPAQTARHTAGLVSPQVIPSGAHGDGISAVPAAAVDVPMIRNALDALTAYERQFGGGDARAYAVDYLRHIVQPRVRMAASEGLSRGLGALAVEFSLRVASMQLDAGDARASRELLGAGLSMAQETGNLILVAWALARVGELDIHEGNVERALAYTGGAAAMVQRSSPRARSFILAKHALALSMTGDRTETIRAIRTSQDGLENTSGNGEPAWMRSYGLEHIRHDEARCLNNLGMGDRAVIAAEESMRFRRLSRPRAFSLAVQAIGHIQSKDKAVDRACEIGSELVAVTGEIASDRVRVELARVLTALRPYRRSAAVRELADAARPVLAGSPR